MNRHHASALSLATTIAAIAAAAAITAGTAYAETPTIDNTPFVSTRARAEVQSEVMNQRGSASATEWAMQHNSVPKLSSGYTSEQARSAYQAARQEVAALTSEDSGSSYFARQAARSDSGIKIAVTR